MKGNRFNLIFLSFMIFIILISCESNNNAIKTKNDKILIELGKTQKEISFVFTSLPQERKIRKWKKIKMEYKYKIGGIEDTTLYFPTRIKTDSLNNIYVLDSKDCCVKKFNKDGRYLSKIGKKGNGPGEFITPSKFDVRPNGKVAILDPNLNKCVIFDGEKTYLIKSRFNPIDVCFVSEDEVVLLQVISVIEDSFLRKYNYKTNQLNEYNNIIDIEKHSKLVLGAFPPLQGYILNNDKKLLYVPKFIKSFLLYDKNGIIENGFKTMKDDNDKILENSAISLSDFRIPNKFRSLIDATLLENKLIIWDYQKSIENKKTSFDFYNASNGKYLYSVQIILKDAETKISTVYFTKSNIYVLNDKSELEVYEYRIL